MARARFAWPHVNGHPRFGQRGEHVLVGAVVADRNHNRI